MTDILHAKCKKSDNPETIASTIDILRRSLSVFRNACGLAANQIDINESICVINVKREIIFVNPEIISNSKGVFRIFEGCVSFPNEIVQTKRFAKIIVRSSNHPDMIFEYKDADDLNNLELACVQHEIDHLNGIDIFFRKSTIEWRK